MHVENWCGRGSSAWTLTLTLSVNVLLLSGKVRARTRSLWRFHKWVSFIFLFSEFKVLSLCSFKGKKELALPSDAWSHSGHLVTHLIQLFHSGVARQWKENIYSSYIFVSIWLLWNLTGAVQWLDCCHSCLLSIQVALKKTLQLDISLKQ